MKKIAILTTSGDIHASQVCDVLLDMGADVRLVFTDLLSNRHQLGIRISAVAPAEYTISDIDGRRFDLREMSAVWWRRFSIKQRKVSFLETEHRQMAEQDWETVFYSGFSNEDSIAWISNPVATRQYSNKIKQLNAAVASGFYVPETTITNCAEFAMAQLSEVDKIVKPLTGLLGTPIFTREVQNTEIRSESLQSGPAIIQQKISGEVNWRVNVFGDQCYAFEILNKELDWRPDIGRARYIEIDGDTKRCCQAFLKSCGLRMGIFDFKIDKSGTPYFLECNPQGQFTFLEPLTGFPIAKKFAEFLCE